MCHLLYLTFLVVNLREGNWCSRVGMRVEHGNRGILGLTSDQHVTELVQQLKELGTSNIFQVHDLLQMMITP